MLEKEIERRVCLHAKEHGMLVYKFNSPARAAVPDRMLIYKGKVFFIEFKAEGKKPTVPQAREHEKLRQAGMVVFVIDSDWQGKRIIELIAMGVSLQTVYKEDLRASSTR